MTGGLPFERLFSLPAFEGMRTVRSHLVQQPGISVAEAISIVQAVEIDALGFDLVASAALLDIIPASLSNEGVPFYRGCIRQVLLTFQPSWARTMLQGRTRFYATLERDEQSLFRQAGILDDPPGDDFVEWWDALTGELRLIVDMRKFLQGRRAERLTLALEEQRLAKDGIDEKPRWVGLDDNTKGYDVLSFEWAEGNVVNKLIEVKSTIASPLRYRVTRNEWEQANRSGIAYVFHVWDMTQDPPILHMRTVEQVRPHIPVDQDKGKWKDVEIPVGPPPA